MLAALLLEHTGVCGGLREGPERFRISCTSGELVQVRAEPELPTDFMSCVRTNHGAAIPICSFK